MPTHTQWNEVIANNTSTTIGSFRNSEYNFGTARHYGSSTSPKSLTLPAVGYRDDYGGLVGRGSDGFYWSSTGAIYLKYNARGTGTESGQSNFGFAVRCVAE